MKALFLIPIYITCIIGILPSVAIAQPTPPKVDDIKFLCGVSRGFPATIARTPRGNITLILWKSEYFSSSGWTPQRRCEAVSARFQLAYTNDALNYITTGRKNGYPVVCLARSLNGACSGILFTVKSGGDARRKLELLESVRIRVSGPLDESTGRNYFDILEFVRMAPPDPDATVPQNPKEERQNFS